MTQEKDMGRPTVHFNDMSGFICGDNWTDVEAAAACRGLGYPRGQVHIIAPHNLPSVSDAQYNSTMYSGVNISQSNTHYTTQMPFQNFSQYDGESMNNLGQTTNVPDILLHTISCSSTDENLDNCLYKLPDTGNCSSYARIKCLGQGKVAFPKQY